MWKKILIVQTVICIVLSLAYHFELSKRDELVSVISVHYTAGDIFRKSKESIKTVTGIPAAVTNNIIGLSDTDQYGKPVDECREGTVTPVYAVSGGKIIETGENQELGKYIKIRHEEAVSIYGNCSAIYMNKGEFVRKGQVIASYYSDKERPFIYNLSEQ